MASENLIILEKTDSTNNYAMGLVQKGAAVDGQRVFAYRQTAGKGRRGKSWQSETGANILLTINAQMQWLPVKEQFQLSAAIAVGCLDFFSRYLQENISIKWPNDIYINDRKAGGILIENVIKGSLWQWSVIGIGLNVNQETFETGLNAVSLRQVTGEKYEVIQLADMLYQSIQQRIIQLKDGEFNQILLRYNEHLFCKNRQVGLKKGNTIFTTTVKAVSAAGSLLTEDVLERQFEFNDVEWLIHPPVSPVK
jgi:BirA family biotin operon repressor/biotin-[acetyl-CoA-carboxylase] ligase